MVVFSTQHFLNADKSQCNIENDSFKYYITMFIEAVNLDIILKLNTKV